MTSTQRCSPSASSARARRPRGTIYVYEQALEAGMRVPLHGFLCEVLAHFGIASSRIAPNGWRAMAGFIVLSHFTGVAPSLPVFRHFFMLYGFKSYGTGRLRCLSRRPFFAFRLAGYAKWVSCLGDLLEYDPYRQMHYVRRILHLGSLVGGSLRERRIDRVANFSS